MSKKASVDPNKCIGCGLCVTTCPAVFKLDDETQKSTVIEGSSCEKAGCCQQAAEGCPAKAISVTEEEVGK